MKTHQEDHREIDMAPRKKPAQTATGTAANTDEYNSASIQHLDQHAHLLKRIALTFGDERGSSESPFSTQKTTALRELSDNASDEISLKGEGRIRIAFYKDHSFEVQDSGRGIPVDSSLDGNGRMVSGIFKSLGLIQSGGKFGNGSNRFSSGLNGVGASSTVHTSKRSDITVFRNGKRYELSFKDGLPGFFDVDGDPESDFTELEDYSYVRESKDDRSKEEKALFPTGTIVKVWLRDEVFQSDYPYDDQDLIARMKATAYLIPGMTVDVYNELNMVENPDTSMMEPQKEEFHFEDGLQDLLETISPDQPITNTIHLVTEGSYLERRVPVLQDDGTVKSTDVQRTVPIELLLHYGNKYEYTVDSYVNTIHTKGGGVHEDAMMKALVSTFNNRIKSMRGMLTSKDQPPSQDDFKEGLSAVLSIKVSEPSFKDQTKNELGGPEVKRAIVKALTDEFTKWIESRKNSDDLQVIAKKVTTAAKNRQKAQEQREINRAKTQISSASLPVKLLDCKRAGTDESELYICEGDSALSSMKAARDGNTQALLPIRGKFTNAFKSDMKAILANEVVQSIISSLGAGSGSSFDPSKCRYQRIFFATDADPDGNSIAVLLYGLFWKLFKPLINENRVFIARVPLFTIEVGKGKKRKIYYAQDEDERDSIVADLREKGIKVNSDSIKRMKGLGEMNAEDLSACAMDPNTRTVVQIWNADEESTEAMLNRLLGPDSHPRKEWLENSEVDMDAVRE